MIVRSTDGDDLTAKVALLVRLETALYAIKEAWKVAHYSDDKASLKGMQIELGDMIKVARDEIGLP